MDKTVMEVIYFTSPRCNVCKVLKPAIQGELISSFPNINFKTVNIEEEPHLAAAAAVYSAPVILLLIDGKEYLREGRNISLPSFFEKIERLVKLSE